MDRGTVFSRDMCLISSIRSLPVLAALFLATVVSGQSLSRNDPYTPSPMAIKTASYTTPDAAGSPLSNRETQIYKVGPGDVLFINLTNSQNGTGFYPVLQDGAIDFGLSGEKLIVIGKTPDEIARVLESKITLYRDPQVEVRVREFASHNITVSGLVSNGGRQYIQREAVPLYVVRAAADVNPRASKVIIRSRTLGVASTYELNSAATENILIRAGDDIEFTQS
jgi:protein involved in polysaccharide export with SLBB domain